MKRIITLMLSVIIIISVFSGCKAKEAEYPRGWIDDIDALSIKINRMNEYEVHNLLGEPVAKLLNYRSDVYLDSEEVGVFVFYNEEDGTVERLEREKSYTEQVVDVTAQKRCEVMSKLIGRTKDEICSRYGEFSSTSKDLTVCRYKDFDGVKVSIYFNQNNIAEKLAMKAKGEPQNESEEEIPSENNLDPIKLLDDIALLREQVIGMNYRDTLDLFGDPQGVMEEDDCQVYFDSNNNGIFLYFDEQRKVSNIDKVIYADVKDKDGYSLKDDELLTVLMNKYIGHSKFNLPKPFDDTVFCYVSDKYYGHKNIFGKRVDIYFDNDYTVKTVAINIFVNDILVYDNETVKEMLTGLTHDEVSSHFGQYQCWIAKDNCYGYLSRRGDGIFVYYGNGNKSYKVEIVNGDDVKFNGADTYIEKLTMLMINFTVKTESEIIDAYGQPDEYSDVFGDMYENIDGMRVWVHYEESKVLYVSVI